MEQILVSTEELAAHLDDPDWIVFDTRHDLGDAGKGRRAYDAGHIPGAYFLHVDDDLSGTKTGRNGRHPLPDLASFAAKLNARGITAQSHVVVYDDLGGNFAVRLWWMLRWLGHERTALLDGGFPLWVKQGRPLTQEAPAPRKGAFVPRPHAGWTVDANFVERIREGHALMLLDARAENRFAGLQEPIDPVAGHIPGAVNHFWQKNLMPDGLFKAPGELRKEYEAVLAGVAPTQSVHMCGSGVTACHNLFAMELAGLPGGRLYPGSWSEWCADPTRAMSTRPQDQNDTRPK
jgi:thiosulfate/3-mercaptopyruvate sulfurtransferase